MLRAKLRGMLIEYCSKAYSGEWSKHVTEVYIDDYFEHGTEPNIDNWLQNK